MLKASTWFMQKFFYCILNTSIYSNALPLRKYIFFRLPLSLNTFYVNVHLYTVRFTKIKASTWSMQNIMYCMLCIYIQYGLPGKKLLLGICRRYVLYCILYNYVLYTVHLNTVRVKRLEASTRFMQNIMYCIVYCTSK